MIDCLFTWDTRTASVKRVRAIANLQKWPYICEHFDELDNSQYRTICFDNEAIGLFRHWYEDENVYFSIQTKLKDRQLLFNCLLFTESFLVKRFHPKRLICSPTDKENIKLLNKVGFYPKGHRYQKVIEKMRYDVKDICFDDYGYIINQGKMDNIPFGLFNTMKRGCGWIGAYNLLRMYGNEMPMEKISKQLSRYDVTGKLFGQDVYTLYYWLRKQGLPVKLSMFSQKKAVSLMKNSSFGILLYIHKRGSHYITYRRLNSNQFIFYNAVYGAKNHIMSAEEFISKYTFIPMNMLIYVV